jgi:hypothetical protein
MNSLTVYLNGALIPLAWLKQPDTAQALQACEFGQVLLESQISSQTYELNAVPSATLFEAALGKAHELDGSLVCALQGYVDDIAPGAWRIDPIALRVAIDHLVLGSAQEASLTPDESKELMHAIGPLFFEHAGHLVQATADRWYWEQAGPFALTTASPEAARGRNIQAYLPTGQDSKIWRRLLNEVQMTWFAHEINTLRERRGALPINGVWICGPITAPHTKPFDGYLGSVHGLANAFAKATNRLLLQHHEPLPTEGSYAYIDETLNQARQSEDFTVWLEGVSALGKALDHRIQHAASQGWSIHFVLAGESRLLELAWVTRKPWQFWRKPLPLETLVDQVATQ